jgi:processive 1,2-diacylglycerol beta-glucosyltransferase
VERPRRFARLTSLPRRLPRRWRARFRAQRRWWRTRRLADADRHVLFPEAGGGMVAVDTLAGGSAAGPRIAILHATAGMGHMAAAKAVAASVSRLEPAALVREVDALLFASRFYRDTYGRGYDVLAARAPRLWGMLYRSWEAAPLRRGTPAVRLIDRLNMRRLARVVEREHPDVILCTHFLPVEAFAPFRGEGALRIPLYCVITDFVAHPFWAMPHVDRYFVATEAMADDLAGHGVARERIVVTGIPIDARFATGIGRDAARTRLGVDAKRPLVLVMGGGSGVGPLATLSERIAALPSRPLVVTVCGSNDRLREQIGELPAAIMGDIRPLGFTREVDVWMEAADVLVGKAGGLTCSEAMARQLPMVVYRPTPGQEVRNADVLQAAGAAMHVETLEDVGQAVERWLTDTAARDRARAAAAQLARPHAADTIAEFVLAAARTHAASGRD